MYRCEAVSVEGFVQQIAVSLVLHGYFFYVTGEIPDKKDPRVIDTKLIARYRVDISKFTRCRQRRGGIAGVQYLRHGRFFVLMATEGNHEFFELEGRMIADIRVQPLQCFDYSIGCYQRRTAKWHPSVRIAAERFRIIKKDMILLALSVSELELAERIHKLPFAPFAPVRSQCFSLLRFVNRRRNLAGLALVSDTCVRRRRKPVKVFELQGLGECGNATPSGGASASRDLKRGDQSF